MRVRPFGDWFKDVAVRQMYMTWLTPPGKEFTPRDCWLLEYYCDEPECDPRIVVLDAVSSEEPRLLATIEFGWESRDFYRDACTADEETLEALREGRLDKSGPTDERAHVVLEAVKKEFLSNPRVVARFRRHYEMFRRELRRRARLAAKEAATVQPHRTEGALGSTKLLAALLGLGKGRRGKPRGRFRL
jgi:hypothetical protein